MPTELKTSQPLSVSKAIMCCQNGCGGTAIRHKLCQKHLQEYNEKRAAEKAQQRPQSSLSASPISGSLKQMGPPSRAPPGSDGVCVCVCVCECVCVCVSVCVHVWVSLCVFKSVRPDYFFVKSTSSTLLIVCNSHLHQACPRRPVTPPPPARRPRLAWAPPMASSSVPRPAPSTRRTSAPSPTP
jgi:hypothetical protein